MYTDEREVVVADDAEGLVRGVKKKIADGFVPFGPKIVYMDESAEPTPIQFYQAVHKLPPGDEGARFVNLTGLTRTELFIISFLFNQPWEMTSLPHLIKAFKQSSADTWRRSKYRSAVMLFKPSELIFAVASLEKRALIYYYRDRCFGVVLLRLSIRTK